MPTDDARLMLGDCLDRMGEIADGSVDAVVTDPPYPAKFDSLWYPFAAESYRVLRDGGELITLLGHYQLPTVMSAFSDTPMRYWWICGMAHDTSKRMLGKDVCIRFKPALWYVKGKKRKALNLPMDLLNGGSREKSRHPWEQPVPWFEHWCDRICGPGEVVLDPFMGSGTTGIACLRTGRRFIGIEKDPATFATAQARILAHQASMPLLTGVA